MKTELYRIEEPAARQVEFKITMTTDELEQIVTDVAQLRSSHAARCLSFGDACTLDQIETFFSKMQDEIEVHDKQKD